jgi:hypothetical protein
MLRKKKPKACEEYTKIVENEENNLLEFSDNSNSDWINDLLISEIYAKERGASIQVRWFQLDETGLLSKIKRINNGFG